MRGVTKRYPTRPTAVLEGVELVVERGGIAYVGGDNGAGKTTLLRIITGIIAPDRGTVRVCGLDPARDRRAFQRALGFAGAGNAGLHARLTVRQHLDVWARVALVPKSAHRARVAELLDEFALGDLSASRCDRISMGQRQRLRLAIALIGRPELVLLDEPQTSLDTAGREVLSAALRRLIDRGGAVIWCSPELADLPVAATQAHRLLGGHLLSSPSVPA